MFKTALEVAGLDADQHTPVGAGTDSRSFALYLADQNAPSIHPCHFTTRFNSPQINRDGNTIASSDYKLIQYSNDSEEFFDRSDEETNLFTGQLTASQNENYTDLIEKMSALVDPPKVLSVVRDDGSLARQDLITKLAFQFNQNVEVASDDLVVRNDSASLTVDLSQAQFSYDPSTFTATWDLSLLVEPLDAAFYTFNLASGDVAGIDGGKELDGDGDGEIGPDFGHTLYVAIPGDTNLSGNVDVLSDATSLINNLGLQVDATWSDGDFDGDGDVDIIDAGGGDAVILFNNLRRNVQPPQN